jgi:hypothetical protein
MRNQGDDPQTSQPPPSHRRSLGALAIAWLVIVVVVLAAAVVGFTLTRHSRRAAVTKSQVTTPAANTTTSPASSSPSTSAGSITPGGIPAAQVDPPSLAGAYTPDPIAVMRAISAYSDWLFAHPNPALLANYMFPTCRLYKGVEAELTTLADHGWHARPSVEAIQWIKVNPPFMPAPGLLDGHPAYVGGGVKVVITSTPQSADVLNSAGQVVTRFNDQKPLEMVGIFFAQGPDGRFRIIDEVAFNPPGGVSEFES